MTSETPCLPGCREVRDWFPGYHNHACPNAPKPVEPPACGCFGPCGNPDCCERCAEPQSEPPISDGVGVGIANLFIGHEAETAGKVLARAYLALKQEASNGKS